MRRIVTIALSAVLVLALAPVAGAGHQTKSPAPPEDGGIGNMLIGRDATVELKIVEYDPGSGFGQVIMRSSGGSWVFRPEVGDEVIVGLTLESRHAFRAFARKGGGYLRMLPGTGEVTVTLTTAKTKFTRTFEASKVLFTRPGERGFFLDDIIIGATATYSGVTGLLIPAVQ